MRINKTEKNNMKLCDYCKQKKKVRECKSNLISNKIFELCKECFEKRNTQEFIHKFQEVLA
jgi:hypothetical protein